MKKILSLAAAIMMMGCLTSCQQLQSLAQNQNVQSIAKVLLTNAVQTNGTTYNYSGTYSAQLLKMGSNSQYTAVNSKAQTGTITCPVVVGQTGAITIPSITIDGITMSEVSLGNLTIGTATSGNTLAVSESTTGAGTLTVNGTAQSLSSVYVECTYNTASTMTYKMSIYFGSNLDYAMNIEFTGKVG